VKGQLYRLTQAAERHLSEILGSGEDAWGPNARDRYQSLIEQAINDLAENPGRLGAQVVDGRIHYHLRHSKSRALLGHVRRPRHILVCKIVDDILVVLAAGHDAMEPGLMIRIQEGEGS
jgi:toxin ParE1/3/4